MFPNLSKYDVIALDTETTGVYYPKDRAFSVGIATPDGLTYYWDFRETPEVIDYLRQELGGFRGTIVGHNIGFDYKMLYAVGVKMNMASLDDTIIRAVMIDENHGVVYPWTKRPMSYSLDDLAGMYLGKSKDHSMVEKAKEILGSKLSRGVIMSRLRELPSSIVGEYCKIDAKLALDLWKWQEKEIDRQEIRRIVEFERSLIPAFLKAQIRGISVDLNEAHRAAGELTLEIERTQYEINKEFGKSVNCNSPKQLKEAFEAKQDTFGNWVSRDGTTLPKTKTGAPSFGADALRTMKDPVAEKVLALKSTIKTRDTFIKGHVIGHAVDGKVYPTINQTAGEEGGTRTGRLSYTEPAMQQIPSRNKAVARIVKPIFIPPEGYSWVDTDLHSFEVRSFAHLVAAYNPALAQVYAKDKMTDFHQYVAELTGLSRNAEYSGQPNAKQLNLCVGGVTEYLSPNGWKRIDEYDGGLVAQWSDGKTEFVQPTRYHQGHSNDVYEISAKWGSIIATGNHRIPILSPMRDGYCVRDRFVGEMSRNKKRSYSMITTWKGDSEECNWSDNDLQLAAAWQADGCIGTSISWTFRRDRKIHRIKELLNDGGYQYTESDNSSGTRIGVIRDNPRTGCHGESQTFKWMVKDFNKLPPLSARQKKLLIDEVIHWDGSTSGGVTYYTSVKSNADYIQLCCASIGIEASLKQNVNNGYEVRVGIKNRRSFMSYNIRPTDSQPVYCFTVPSGYFIARSDDQIWVSGNSMIFNSGRGAIADKMGMEWEWSEFTNKEGDVIKYKKPGPEAIDVINMYHSRVIGVKELADRAKMIAEKRGYIKTQFGRRLRFRNGYKSYAASGLLIQATAADINKENWKLIDEVFSDPEDGHLILNTHDSYSMAMAVGKEDSLIKEIKGVIERPAWRVPIVLDLNGKGSNWWEAISGENRS